MPGEFPGANPPSDSEDQTGARIEGISAVTLITRDMARSLRFYKSLGFVVRYGGDEAAFTSLHAGDGFLNLTVQTDREAPTWWGRVIFYVSDVDALYGRALANGLKPEGPPRDAQWGERYFHLIDPDGHELSFAKPISEED